MRHKCYKNVNYMPNITTPHLDICSSSSKETTHHGLIFQEYFSKRYIFLNCPSYSKAVSIWTLPATHHKNP